MFNRILLGGASLPAPITNMGGNPQSAFDGITNVGWFDTGTSVQKNGIVFNTYDPWIGLDYGAGNNALLSSWKTYHSNDLGALGVGNETVSAKLQGSNDLAIWTDVGAVASAADTANLTLTQISGLGTTPYRAWRIIFKSARSPTANIACVELELTVAP